VTPDDLVVERVTGERDLDEVSALEAECFTNPWSREALGAELARNEFARVYVGRLPEQPVAAFCACWLVADELHINTIAVAPAWRRRGLGRHLMRRILADAARQGLTRATLEVRQSNLPARRMYEGLGFRLRGVRPRYYSVPEEDALIYWLEIAPETRQSGAGLSPHGGGTAP
jgi:ribosomal-protein-alanine N-acetyltransferase